MMSPVTTKTAVILAFLWLPILFGANDVSAVEATVEAASEVATGATGVTNTDLWAPTLRMILGLGGVLVVLGVLAFVAKRLRRGNAFRSGMIEIVSGVSLGGREKVVLLRVGGDEILVGMSPSGMRPLHVLHRAGKQHAEPTEPEPAEFDTYMGTLKS